MAYKENDFVKVEFDIFANEKLVQTTDKKKAQDSKLELKSFGPQNMIIGKAFILKALDDDIITNKSDSNTLELTPDKAYGKRDKNYIKTFPKSAFDEQKLRAVPGIAYDFNGMVGIVKTVVGGRVMVDFNNPLAGKDIKISYKIVGKIEELKEKLEVILDTVLKMPKENFNLNIKDKNIILEVPKELNQIKDKLEKELKKVFEEYILEVNDYSIEIQSFKKE